jgi:taurine dioxygenase
LAAWEKAELVTAAESYSFFDLLQIKKVRDLCARKVRPAVIRHPVSGRPILFLNPMHTHGIAGMERAAAWQLIEELAAHATQNRFTYYHSWRVGDLVMWDERATMHRGAGDSDPSQRRVMLRTIVYPN